jgi:hypothetical protein
MHDHVDDFVAFTDEEIAAITAFLHEEREMTKRLSLLSNFDVVKSGVECDMKIVTRSVCIGRFSCASTRESTDNDLGPFCTNPDVAMSTI